VTDREINRLTPVRESEEYPEGYTGAGIRAAKTLKAASTSIMRVVSQEVTSFPEEEFDVHEN
jgi:hypothetical protein